MLIGRPFQSHSPAYDAATSHRRFRFVPPRSALFFVARATSRPPDILSMPNPEPARLIDLQKSAEGGLVGTVDTSQFRTDYFVPDPPAPSATGTAPRPDGFPFQPPLVAAAPGQPGQDGAPGPPAPSPGAGLVIATTSPTSHNNGGVPPASGSGRPAHNQSQLNGELSQGMALAGSFFGSPAPPPPTPVAPAPVAPAPVAPAPVAPPPSAPVPPAPVPPPPSPMTPLTSSILPFSVGTADKAPASGHAHKRPRRKPVKARSGPSASKR